LVFVQSSAATGFRSRVIKIGVRAMLNGALIHAIADTSEWQSTIDRHPPINCTALPSAEKPLMEARIVQIFKFARAAASRK